MILVEMYCWTKFGIFAPIKLNYFIRKIGVISKIDIIILN